MIVEDNTINPLLRQIDLMYINSEISASDADDLSSCIVWVIGKSLNESNINHVIQELRGFKNVISQTQVCKVINEFRKIAGSLMNGN